MAAPPVSPPTYGVHSLTGVSTVRWECCRSRHSRFPRSGAIRFRRRAPPGSHEVQHLGHCWFRLPRHPVNGADDSPGAELPPIHRLQVPLDGPYGQPSLSPQRRHQAYQVDPQALPLHGHAPQGRPGRPSPLAHRASPRHKDMLGHLDRNYRNVDNFPVRCTLLPAKPVLHSGQVSTGCSTRRVGVILRWLPWFKT